MTIAATVSGPPGQLQTNQPIRVLVVDDSAVIRGLIAKALASEPSINVVGTAMHGQAALAWLERSSTVEPAVDVVICDVEMPVMDGLATLDEIHRRYPSLPVIMASSLTTEGAETTVKALARGAVGCVAKPVASSVAAAIDSLSPELTALVKAVARRPLVSALRPSKAPEQVVTRPLPGAHPHPQVVVIGASTGGPKALTEVLAALGGTFPLPVLIVQHMPPMFTPMLARHLEKDSGRPTQEARDGLPIERGHTYVAPGGFHMVIAKRDGRYAVSVNQEPPEHFCRPSVNPLFRSAARTYGAATLAVMLTGMGEDGIEGSRELVATGARLIAQDEATSVVWGMPAAVARAGLAEQVLPLSAVGPAVRRLCRLESR